MAECSSYDFLRTAGAGNTNLNGYYYPTSGLEVLGFSLFLYFNSLSSSNYPQIKVYNLSGSDYAWGIFSSPTLSAYRTKQIYDTLQEVPDCPSGLDWVNGTETTGTLPTVVGKTTIQAHRDLVNALYTGSAPASFTIEAGSITNSMLADNSVTTLKIANGNITTTKLAVSSITTEKLANRSVTYKKLSNDLKNKLPPDASPAFAQGFSPLW